MKKVLCIGATGRMGGAVAKSLVIHTTDVEVIVAGRRRAFGEAYARTLGPRASFRQVDIHNPAELKAAVAGVDLVFNSAGPFQMGKPVVQRAALDAGAHYVDIADDIHYAREERGLSSQFEAKGLSGLVNGGIFPGYSNIMAGELIERGGGAQRVEMNYFIAGTGGAGPTVMSSTFLLTGVPAVEYVDGRAVERRAFTGRKQVQFLSPVDQKATFYLELPEAHSIFETYGVPNVYARFGTAPESSNMATYLTGLLVPQKILRDTERVAKYVASCKPWLDFMDKLVGANLAMRIDVLGNDGVQRTMQYFHESTIEASGTTIAMQVLEVLDGKVKPGVWWPEQAVENKLSYLERAAVDAKLEIIDPSPPKKATTKGATTKTAPRTISH